MTVRTPIQARGGLPSWAVGFTVFVLLVGLVYFASNVSGENPPIAGNPSASPGAGGGGTAAALAIIDQAGCKSCHGSNLEGQASFPSLHGLQNGPTRDNLQQLGKDHPDDWMNIWITGTDAAVSDPAMRGGMPAFGGPPYNLTADQIQTVVAYLKTLQ
jgi:mono/diheme cytochrome c family protein